MKWTVLWKPTAEASLTELWLHADDKASVPAAANRIDAALRRDPLSVGESRDRGRRVHFDLPLGVLFTVDAMDRTVFIIQVWRVN